MCPANRAVKMPFDKTLRMRSKIEGRLSRVRSFSENNIDFSYFINRRFLNRNPIGFGQTCGGGTFDIMLFYVILCYVMLFCAIFHAI